MPPKNTANRATAVLAALSGSSKADSKASAPLPPARGILSASRTSSAATTTTSVKRLTRPSRSTSTPSASLGASADVITPLLGADSELAAAHAGTIAAAASAPPPPPTRVDYRTGTSRRFGVRKSEQLERSLAAMTSLVEQHHDDLLGASDALLHGNGNNKAHRAAAVGERLREHVVEHHLAAVLDVTSPMSSPMMAMGDEGGPNTGTSSKGTAKALADVEQRELIAREMLTKPPQEHGTLQAARDSYGGLVVDTQPQTSSSNNNNNNAAAATSSHPWPLPATPRLNSVLLDSLPTSYKDVLLRELQQHMSALTASFNERDRQRVEQLEGVRAELETMAISIHEGSIGIANQSKSLEERERAVEGHRMRLTAEYERHMADQSLKHKAMLDVIQLEKEQLHVSLREKEMALQHATARMGVIEREHDTLLATVARFHKKDEAHLNQLADTNDELIAARKTIRQLEEASEAKDASVAKALKEKEASDKACQYYMQQLKDCVQKYQLLEQQAAAAEAARYEQSCAELAEKTRKFEAERQIANVLGRGVGGLSSTSSSPFADMRPSDVLAQQFLANMKAPHVLKAKARRMLVSGGAGDHDDDHHDGNSGDDYGFADGGDVADHIRPTRKVSFGPNNTNTCPSPADIAYAAGDDVGLLKEMVKTIKHDMKAKQQKEAAEASEARRREERERAAIVYASGYSHPLLAAAGGSGGDDGGVNGGARKRRNHHHHRRRGDQADDTASSSSSYASDGSVQISSSSSSRQAHKASSSGRRKNGSRSKHVSGSSKGKAPSSANKGKGSSNKRSNNNSPYDTTHVYRDDQHHHYDAPNPHEEEDFSVSYSSSEGVDAHHHRNGRDGRSNKHRNRHYQRSRTNSDPPYGDNDDDDEEMLDDGYSTAHTTSATLSAVTSHATTAADDHHSTSQRHHQHPIGSGGRSPSNRSPTQMDGRTSPSYGGAAHGHHHHHHHHHHHSNQPLSSHHNSGGTTTTNTTTSTTTNTATDSPQRQLLDISISTMSSYTYASGAGGGGSAHHPQTQQQQQQGSNMYYQQQQPHPHHTGVVVDISGRPQTLTPPGAIHPSPAMILGGGGATLPTTTHIVPTPVIVQRHHTTNSVSGSSHHHQHHQPSDYQQSAHAGYPNVLVSPSPMGSASLATSVFAEAAGGVGTNANPSTAAGVGGRQSPTAAFGVVGGRQQHQQVMGNGTARPSTSRPSSASGRTTNSTADFSDLLVTGRGIANYNPKGDAHQHHAVNVSSNTRVGASSSSRPSSANSRRSHSNGSDRSRSDGRVATTAPSALRGGHTRNASAMAGGGMVSRPNSAPSNRGAPQLQHPTEASTKTTTSNAMGGPNTPFSIYTTPITPSRTQRALHQRRSPSSLARQGSSPTIGCASSSPSGSTVVVSPLTTAANTPITGPSPTASGYRLQQSPLAGVGASSLRPFTFVQVKPNQSMGTGGGGGGPMGTGSAGGASTIGSGNTTSSSPPQLKPFVTSPQHQQLQRANTDSPKLLAGNNTAPMSSSPSQRQQQQSLIGPTPASSSPAQPPAADSVASFVASLKASKAQILATGNYTEEDDLIVQMTQRIETYSRFLEKGRFGDD